MAQIRVPQGGGKIKRKIGGQEFSLAAGSSYDPNIYTFTANTQAAPTPSTPTTLAISWGSETVPTVP